MKLKGSVWRVQHRGNQTSLKVRSPPDKEVVAVRSDGALGDGQQGKGFILSPYLSHEPVGTGVLLIFEYDVCVIIGSQLFKSLGVSCDLAFVSAACPKGLLRHIGDELLVRKRCQLLRVSSSAVAPARSASHPRGHQGQADETEQYDSGTEQHFCPIRSQTSRRCCLYRLPLPARATSLSPPLLRFRLVSTVAGAETNVSDKWK